RKPRRLQARLCQRSGHGAPLARQQVAAQPELQTLVLDRLGRGWSPQQVAGRLAREQGRTVISHETIYRFIAAQIARTKDYAWRRYLPRGKSKRGYRGRRGGSSAEHIKNRVPIALRPPGVADRAQPGH